MTSHWYIVHTYSNFEKKAAEEIKRQKSGYKLEKKKFCRFCRKHTSHKEHKL